MFPLWQSSLARYESRMTNHAPATDPRSYLNSEWLQMYEDYLPTARAWWDKNTRTKSAFGVEQTTARSYSTGQRGASSGPVAVFNEWASYQVQALEQDLAWRRTLGTREGFDRAHAGFAASLAAHWQARVAAISAINEADASYERQRRVSRELTVGQKYKFVDLFVRYLWIERSDRTRDADSSLPHARAPLDRKSLHVLSATFNGILMAPKFSMGMVVSEPQYRYCQALVEIICQEQGGTPLLFDVFAWHHPLANQLYGSTGYKKNSVAAGRRSRKREPRVAE
jgi:hypothetical protein